MYALNCTPYEPMAEIVGSDGCYVFDRSGRRYADFESGVWCASLGHNHPDVNRAIREQAKRVSHLGYRFGCEIVERAAQMLLEILQMPDGKCVFLSSGSEAVEFAVQAAKRMAGKDKPYTLYLQDSFLSSYGQSSTRPADEWIAVSPPVDAAQDWRAALDDIPFERIGALVLEPGNASGLVQLPPKEMIEHLAKRVQKQGGLLVVDEVTTGIGRTGKWFGFEHYDISPDMVAVGKGVGNGYPVSAVAMHGEVAQRLLAGGFHYAQSPQNDPLGCAVVCAVLSRIEGDSLVANAAVIGDRLQTALRALAAHSRFVQEVRGRGLLLAVGLSADAPVAELYDDLCEKGYVAGLHAASRTLRIYPPLIVDGALADGFVQALRQAVHSRESTV